MQNTMDKELLTRFLKCETTPKEEERIVDWLEADPRNRRELDSMQLTMEGLALYSPSYHHKSKRTRSFRIGKLARRSVAAAAVILVAAAVGFGVASRTLAGWETQQTIVEVPAGQRMSITLGDGTSVWLNSGTRLEYPSIFSKKQRRVKVSGEAMFDVEHDAERPFIVETFACQAEVLGTRFNIYANAETSHFSAALLEGKLKVSNMKANNNESVILAPDEMVNLVNGHLRLNRISSHEDFLWTDGLLNLNNLGFEEVMNKFERYFGVNIVVQTANVPQTKYRGKLRISDGLDYALQLLQVTSDFSYERNDDTNTIYIK